MEQKDDVAADRTPERTPPRKPLSTPSHQPWSSPPPTPMLGLPPIHSWSSLPPPTLRDDWALAADWTRSALGPPLSPADIFFSINNHAELQLLDLAPLSGSAPTKEPVRLCPTCQRRRLIYAKGLCRTCYEGLQPNKVKRKARQRKYNATAKGKEKLKKSRSRRATLSLQERAADSQGT